MSDHALIRVRQVLELLGVSKSTLYREIRDNRFPAPEKVRGCSVWPLAQVLKFIKAIEQPSN